MAEKKKILIVEDDPDISMIEEAYLQAAGYDTKILEDGNKVEETLEKEKIALLLLDLMLPGKSGYDICREIRDKTDIPILMVTARTESIHKIRAQRSRDRTGRNPDRKLTHPGQQLESIQRRNRNPLSKP